MPDRNPNQLYDYTMSIKWRGKHFSVLKTARTLKDAHNKVLVEYPCATNIVMVCKRKEADNERIALDIGDNTCCSNACQEKGN